QVGERILQLEHHGVRQRIAAVGPVQSQPRDRAFMRQCDVGIRHGPKLLPQHLWYDTRMKRLGVSLLVVLLCCGADWSAAAADWSTVSTPAPGPTQSIGFSTAGCLQGAQQLPLDAPGYEAIRISRNRYWGQPVMIEYIQALAAKIKAAGQAH